MQGKVLRYFVGHSRGVSSVAFSPDGTQVLSGSTDGTLRLWNMQGKELKRFEGHRGGVISVAFSPDGTQVLSGSSDNTLRLWDMQGKELKSITSYVDGYASIDAHTQAFTAYGGDAWKYMYYEIDDEKVAFDSIAEHPEIG